MNYILCLYYILFDNYISLQLFIYLLLISINIF